MAVRPGLGLIISIYLGGWESLNGYHWLYLLNPSEISNGESGLEWAGFGLYLTTKTQRYEGREQKKYYRLLLAANLLPLCLP